VIALYMDHNVPRSITVGLRLRGVDVITAYEDGADDMDDSALLDRATELGRVLFTHDDDLLAETTKRQQEDISFGGVIYVHQMGATIGSCISDLEVIANAGEPEDLLNQVQFLPL
jgi:hypothetical protein